MAIEVKDVFDLSGPKHLSIVDWKNVDHKRSVAASLVKGVYILERDRQKRRRGTQSALAPHWWQFFHFQLIHQMIDVDSSIFGAIFEFKPQASAYSFPIERAPRYVIAFRGTMIKRKSFLQDLKLDFSIIKQGLHQTSRFQIAMRTVNLFFGASTNISNVWLAGHSMGSAIGMLIGKNLATRRILLDAFLFNPPFPSLPIEKIPDKVVKDGINIIRCHLKGLLNLAINGVEHHRTVLKDLGLATLSTWTPSLFVNREDIICSEYIGYFENKVNMKEIGASMMERAANNLSIIGVIMNAFGSESEAFHRLPSAIVIVNGSSTVDLKNSHGLNQWWGSKLCLKSTRYTN